MKTFRNDSQRNFLKNLTAYSKNRVAFFAKYFQVSLYGQTSLKIYFFDDDNDELFLLYI